MFVGWEGMSEHLCSLFLAFFIAKRNKENV